MSRYRDWHAFAFLQGFWEHLSTMGCGGRTHETDPGWNDAYDRGMNAAEPIIDAVAMSRGL